MRSTSLSCALVLAAACREHEDPAPRPAPIAISIDAAAPPDAPAPKSDERDEHEVFAFGDNRVMAHRIVDGDLVVDAGSAGFARYTRFGLPAPRWSLRVVRDGVRAAAPDRLASLELPLTSEQADAATLILARVWAAQPRTIAIKINGRKADDTAGSAQLEAGWQTIAIGVAKGRLAAGENQVVIETAAAKAPAKAPKPKPKTKQDDRLAIAWLRVARDPQAEGDPRDRAVYDAAADRFLLTSGAGLAWYVQVPDGGHVTAHVAPDDCRVDVKAIANDGGFAAGALGGGDTRVDLSPMSGKVVRLELRARDCPIAFVDRARVTIPGPAPTVPEPGAPPKYVVLWMMDAFRAASVRPFTPGARADVPNFEKLAKTGTVFRQYYEQGNESQTSHSSVWTSTYPAVHNVRLAGVGGTWRIGPQFAVIGEILRDAGFHTIGVTANGFVEENGGYARGFDDFRNMMREKGVINGVIFGEKVIKPALEKLHASLDRPTFLFLGTVDTHGPWIARHPWLEQYDPGPYHGPFQEFGTAFDLGINSQSMGCSKIPPPRDIQRLRAIYDSAVSYQDARLGDFVAQLQKWGIYDQTLLIVTADHGEEMFEHGRCGHGGGLVETLVRVPLLIHYPARFPGGAVVDEGAEGVDLVPTILASVGLPPPFQAQGDALRDLAFGVGRGWVRPSYTSMFEFAHTMRLGTWKATVGRSGTPALYDLSVDPWEQTDVAADHPIERRFMTDALGLFLAERAVWKKREWGVVTAMTPRAALEMDEP
ncbi:MAG TPA: sulfatase [Kofleriaceae bacterium]|nr:sulfatase [Kofleriaceae bacterium]